MSLFAFTFAFAKPASIQELFTSTIPKPSADTMSFPYRSKMTAKSANKEAEKSKAHLLGIPAELRNRIYEYALIERKRIDIDKDKKAGAQPGLLRVNRQIRKEAIGIFYSENRFHDVVHGYHGCALLPFRRQLVKYRSDEMKKNNYMLDVCDGCRIVRIENLAIWLEEYHEDPTLVPALPQNKIADATRAMTLARRTFGVVKAMSKQPWEEVEMVLMVFYDAIEALQAEDMVEESDEEESWMDEEEELDKDDLDDEEVPELTKVD